MISLIGEVAALEVITAISSVLIVVTSVLVLHHIYRKIRRTRSDILFAFLSISDIGVGLLSQTSVGIYPLCINSVIECGSSTVVGFFFLFFPYIFSYIVTTIIAIDRLFVVTKLHSYENLVPKRRLKGIITLAFVISVGFCVWFTFARYHTKENYLLSYIINVVINVILPVIIIASYIYITCFVYRHSSTLTSCRSNGNKDLKRLTKTIMFIFISQTICVIPYQFMLIAVYKGTLLPGLLDYWFFMLRNNSSFFNGIILLLSERRKARKKIETKHETVVKKDLRGNMNRIK